MLGKYCVCVCVCQLNAEDSCWYLHSFVICCYKQQQKYSKQLAPVLFQPFTHIIRMCQKNLPSLWHVTPKNALWIPLTWTVRETKDQTAIVRQKYCPEAHSLACKHSNFGVFVFPNFFQRLIHQQYHHFPQNVFPDAWVFFQFSLNYPFTLSLGYIVIAGKSGFC